MSVASTRPRPPPLATEIWLTALKMTDIAAATGLGTVIDDTVANVVCRAAETSLETDTALESVNVDDNDEAIAAAPPTSAELVENTTDSALLSGFATPMPEVVLKTTDKADDRALAMLTSCVVLNITDRLLATGLSTEMFDDRLKDVDRDAAMAAELTVPAIGR